MKVHRFHATKNGVSYRELTRDKAGKVLSNKRITIDKNTENEVDLIRKDWVYRGKYRLDFSRTSRLVQYIRSEINNKSVCVFEIEKMRPIFVFDIPYDKFNARVYSIDEELQQFAERQNDLELMPDGQQLGHGELEFVGKIENKYFDDLATMDIDVMDIMEAGFHLKIVGEVSKEEELRRFIERSIKKKFEGMIVEGTGIHVMEVNVHDVMFSPEKSSTTEVERENSAALKADEGSGAEGHRVINSPQISINNNPNISINTGNLDQPKKKRVGIFSIIVASIGVIASALTIYLFISQYMSK